MYKATGERQAQRVHSETLVPMGNKVRKAAREPQAQRVHSETPVLMEHKALKVQQACKDQPERPALLVPQEHWSL